MKKLVQLKDDQKNDLYPNTYSYSENIRNLITLNNDVVDNISEANSNMIKVGNIIVISMLGNLKSSVGNSGSFDYNLFSIDKKIRPKIPIYSPCNLGIGSSIWHATTPQYSVLSPTGNFSFKKETQGSSFQLYLIYVVD